MASQELEVLTQAQSAYEAAGTAVEKAYDEYSEARGGLDQAIGAEHEAAETVVKKYWEVLRNGFIIERVLDAAAVSYFAGMTEGNIFNPEDNGDARWFKLDDTHAKELEGAFGSDPTFRMYPRWRDVEALGRGATQSSLIVRFDVAGIHDNNEVDESLSRSWQGDTTEYSGRLEAIEWRLPTEEEIQKFAPAKTVSEVA